MKKATLLAVTAVLIMSLSSLALAAPAPAAPLGYGYGCCGNYSQNYGNMTDEQKAQAAAWQQQMLEQRKQMLAQHVEWGWITQEQADQRMAWMEERVANGTYSGRMGRHAGNGYAQSGNRGWGCW